MPRIHSEFHRSDRIGWLRAAVLGANDGIISVTSLVVGIAASGATAASVLLAGLAGTVAGAISMAAGEYISVQSQADTEAADIEKERNELISQPEHELEELTAIYVGRGLDTALAKQVAEKLMATDALGAHARDELGLSDTLRARPLQASIASAASFTVGALVPMATLLLVPADWITKISSIVAVMTLFALGATAAHLGGAAVIKGGMRVAFWGVVAIGLTALVGKLFGTVL
ncbi:MAG: VIT family protein [Pseudomonadota bacterium]